MPATALAFHLAGGAVGSVDTDILDIDIPREQAKRLTGRRLDLRPFHDSNLPEVANSFLNPRNNSLVHMSFIAVNAFGTAFVHIDDFGVIEAE